MDSIIDDSVEAIRARGGGRPRHFRPFGRRGLLRGGGAVRPRHRQAADLRVREPRPSAQRRARGGGRGVHEAVRRGLHPRARRGALPGASARRDRARNRSAASSARSSGRSSSRWRRTWLRTGAR